MIRETIEVLPAKKEKPKITINRARRKPMSPDTKLKILLKEELDIPIS